MLSTNREGSENLSVHRGLKELIKIEGPNVTLPCPMCRLVQRRSTSERAMGDLGANSFEQKESKQWDEDGAGHYRGHK